MAPSLSVVVPMYNEESHIRLVARAASQVLGQLTDDWEIVMVDDGSRDATAAIAEELARAEPRIRLLRHERNRGLGGSLRTGFGAARKDLVLYTDADLPFDFQELPRAVRLLEHHEADVLAAYRFDRSSEGPLRAAYSHGYNMLVSLVFGLRHRDVNFAFKLFRRALLERFPLTSEGSFIDAELLIRARRAGAKILQIGVDYFPRSRGVSTLSSLGTIARLLRELVAFRLGGGGA